MKFLIILLMFLSKCSVSIGQSNLYETNKYYPEINGAHKATSGDVNGDGFPDLLIVTTHTESILIYLNDGSKQFYLSKNQLKVKDTKDALLEDFDGDGDLDIRVSSKLDDVQDIDSLYLNNGQGVFEIINFQVFNNQVASTQVDLKSGDLNNDGRQDFVRLVRSPQYEMLSLNVFINEGETSFKQIEPAVDGLRFIEMGDFNEDGYLDIWSFNQELTIYLNDGTGGAITN